MSHSIGRVVAVPGTPRIGPDSGAPSSTPDVWEFLFTPQPALEGGTPRLVILHFTSMVFPAGTHLEVNVRYGVDRFSTDGEAFTRPIDPVPGPISIKYFGNGSALGGVTFGEYASGELKTTGPGAPGTDDGRQTHCDVFLEFLEGGKYREPIYETRGRCGATFDWENVACSPTPAEEAAARATCLIVSRDVSLTLSTCTGTLIGPDLVLTAEHCVPDPSELEARSGSVTFDFQANCDGSKPAGYNPIFHKIKRVVRRGIDFVDVPPQDVDWAILQIETPPGGVGITPRTLRLSAPIVGENVFAVHHPNGTVKKIQRTVLNAGLVGNLNQLDVCGGSSGSALFDAAGNIIGAAAHTAGHCSVTYCSAREVANKLATPPAPPAPYDVMLVMDRSGSMGSPGTSPTTPGATKMSDAHEAANLFVDLVRSGGGDRLGLVSFSTTARRPPEVAPNPVTAGQRTALHNAINLLAPDAATSIGDGLTAAMESLPAGAHQRAMLLMTDGLHNTDPAIEAGEALLGNTQLFVVGFGSEGDLDGPRMTTLARDHNGIFNRANDGLQLKKFFSLCFGNIFEAGALADPHRILRRDERKSTSVPFRVCEEERITVVLGWTDPSQTLDVSLTTPGGVTINAATAGVESGRGNTWQFFRVALPHGGERAGTWNWQVARVVTGVEIPPPQIEVRYFVTVLADGGPFLRPVPAVKRYYTGDPVNPLVMLRYRNGPAPIATVTLDIEAPDVPIGKLVAQARLEPAQIGGDTLDPFHATLQKVERTNGPIATRTVTVPLFDDGDHEDGALERDGIYGDVLSDLTRFEGTYSFHASATFGDGCTATREAFWSITVEPSIDPGRTTVTPVDGGIRITPADQYGNPLGPGRGDRFGVFGVPGVTVTGSPIDNGDGSYTVPADWDPAATPDPGVVIAQPGRPPVPVVSKPKPPQSSGCTPSVWMWLAIALLIIVIILLAILLT
jgi:hypothetical protein